MRKNWLSMLVCAGTLCVCAMLFNSAWGAEPKPECPPAPAQSEGAAALFSRVPYLSRLFKQIGAPCDEQAFERIGVDFDAPCQCPEAAGQPLHFECFELRVHPAVFGGECQKASCQAGACPAHACEIVVCPGGQKCPASTCAACSEKGCCKSCSAACECAVSCACEAECACGTKCACESKCACGAKCACTGKADVALWERIVELSTAKATAEAALAAHEESAELVDSLVELSAENAKLAAQVEAQEREHEFFDELLELAKENASLKAKVELAATQTEVLKQMFGAAVENERLKMRIAHLEGHHDSDSPAHTAAKPSEQQPAR